MSTLPHNAYHAWFSSTQGGKLWRPSILLLLDDKEIRHSYRLIDFCNTLKKGGLYILGHTLVGDFQLNTVAARDIKVHWFNFINNHKIKVCTSSKYG